MKKKEILKNSRIDYLTKSTLGITSRNRIASHNLERLKM